MTAGSTIKLNDIKRIKMTALRTVFEKMQKKKGNSKKNGELFTIIQSR